MRILHYEGSWGGSLSAVHSYEVYVNLAKLGHRIVFVKTPPPKPGANMGGEIGTGLSIWKRAIRNLRESWIFERLIGEFTLFYLIWREASIFLSAVALILKNRDRFDVIYRRHNLLNSEYLLSKLFRIPTVKEVNGIVADEMRIGKKGDTASLWIMDKIEKWNMKRADRIIVVTSQLKEVLHNEYNVPKGKIAVIWNGVNTDLFSPVDATAAREKLGLSIDDSLVCYVGSLSRWEGIEYLIYSAPLVLAENPSTQFLIVGDGQMKGELINLARETGVSDKFIFTGLVPYEKVPLYINASNICVAPFIIKRNERIGISPLKLCEYLACEKPVVASRISGLEIIESQEAGVLLPPEAYEPLADAIIELLRDHYLRKKMGENGRKYVVENRSWESVAQKVAEVCQEAAKGV